MKYCIALNFRGSKFLWIAIFEDFVEIFSRICCTYTLHNVCQKFLLKYFRERLKILEKKKENLALYGSAQNVDCSFGSCQEQKHGHGIWTAWIQCKISYSRKLLREKTFANWWKTWFLRRKLSRIARLCRDKRCHPPKFRRENFREQPQNHEIRKGFLPEKIPAIQ